MDNVATSESIFLRAISFFVDFSVWANWRMCFELYGHSTHEHRHALGMCVRWQSILGDVDCTMKRMQNYMLGRRVSQSLTFQHSHPHTHSVCSVRASAKTQTHIHDVVDCAPLYARIVDFYTQTHTHTLTAGLCFVHTECVDYNIHKFFHILIFRCSLWIRFNGSNRKKNAKDKRSLDIRPSNIRFLSRTLIPIVKIQIITASTEQQEKLP